MRWKRRRPSGDCDTPSFTISCAGRFVISSLEADRPLARPVEPVDRAQRRRLARPVRADQRDDLPIAHLQRHALERVDRAVVRVHVRELEDGAVGPGRSELTMLAPRPRYASITRSSLWTS